MGFGQDPFSETGFGLAPFSETPNPSLHPVGLTGVRRPPLHRLRCRRGAEAPLRAARPTRGQGPCIALQCNPKPVPLDGCMERRTGQRDAFWTGPVQRNALGLGLRGASAPLLHCEAMQPPVRPTPVGPIGLVRLLGPCEACEACEACSCRSCIALQCMALLCNAWLVRCCALLLGPYHYGILPMSTASRCKRPGDIA
jgi:hypothetical protein